MSGEGPGGTGKFCIRGNPGRIPLLEKGASRGNRVSPAVSPAGASRRRATVTGGVSISRLGLDLEGHQDRVHELPATPIVAESQPLAHEAETFVKADRGLVVGEHVELELPHA
jgi:hypothetical protein